MILARLWIILRGSGCCESGMRVDGEILMLMDKICLRNGYGQFCKCYLGFLGAGSVAYGDVWLGNGQNLS